MRYLLDTCDISELIKPLPEIKVLNWLDRINEKDLYLSVLTIGEITKGVEKLRDSRKKDSISAWLNHDLLNRFSGRILKIDFTVARNWGLLAGINEKKGLKSPVIDSLLAASAKSHHLTLATRNIHDFKNLDCTVFNPWD